MTDIPGDAPYPISAWQSVFEAAMKWHEAKTVDAAWEARDEMRAVFDSVMRAAIAAHVARAPAGLPPFDQEWAKKVDAGFKYGREALANVKFGYSIAAEALASQASTPVGEVAIPEIDYEAAIHHAFKTMKIPQGTRACVAFAKGAEWFRAQCLAASPASVGEVAGWKWVPVKPTEEMLEAAAIYRRDVEVSGKNLRTSELWDAMLAASPAPAGGQVPLGAIINGRTLADRLEAYPFESQGGDLRLCSDWVEFRRCFEYLADYVAAGGQAQGAVADTKRLDYLDRAANEMLLEFGFEIDGGVYLRIDAPGHGGTDIREKNSVRAAIDSAMVVAPC